VENEGEKFRRGKVEGQAFKTDKQRKKIITVKI